MMKLLHSFWQQTPLARLDGRYRRLASDLPGTEQPDLLASAGEPRERGFRQLGEEASPLWDARFPERAGAAGKELTDAVLQRLRRRQQPAPARDATAPTPTDDDFEPFEDETTDSQER